jgi:hypothetical protein
MQLVKFVTSNTEVDEILFEYLQSLEVAKKDDNKEILERQEIIATIEQQKNNKKTEKENEERIPDYKKIFPRMQQYYYSIPQIPRIEQYFFVYTPAGISITRVPQQQLGHGVLGVAYPGSGIIKIADHLFGLDFEEVKKHEINHMLYPFLTEHEIRLKTKMELPFETRYH